MLSIPIYRSHNYFVYKVCCGEIEGDGTPIDSAVTTFKSTHTGDASVSVTRLSSGTGERLGGTWYISLDGEASERIAANALAEEVLIAVSNLTSAGNVTVTDGENGEGFNGERSWVIQFHDWNDPNHTLTTPVFTVGSESLTGINAMATVSGGKSQVSEFCEKAVVEVTSSLSAGEINDCVFTADWRGGTSYAVPAFNFNANSSVVEEALATVDREILGKVWVSRAGTTASGGGIWNITFVENTEGRVPELDCASDAEALQMVNATCEAIAGFFAFDFDGNVTQYILHNSTELEVSDQLRLLRSTC